MVQRLRSSHYAGGVPFSVISRREVGAWVAEFLPSLHRIMHKRIETRRCDIRVGMQIPGRIEKLVGSQPLSAPSVR